jgi:hypothetical protein
MRRWSAITAVALELLLPAAMAGAQSVSIARVNFSGVWILNRDLSDKAAVDVAAGASGQRGDQGGNRTKGTGRGEFDRLPGRGSFDTPGDRGYRGDEYGLAPDTRNRATAVELLIDELRKPSSSLTISHADPMLTVTNAADRTRLFQTNGQKDPHQFGATTVLSASRWDGDRLVTEYEVAGGRKIRIVYSIIPETRQLLEQVTFANGQTSKRVYDRARSTKPR